MLEKLTAHERAAGAAAVVSLKRSLEAALLESLTGPLLAFPTHPPRKSGLRNVAGVGEARKRARG